MWQTAISEVPVNMILLAASVVWRRRELSTDFRNGLNGLQVIDLSYPQDKSWECIERRGEFTDSG